MTRLAGALPVEYIPLPPPADIEERLANIFTMFIAAGAEIEAQEAAALPNAPHAEAAGRADEALSVVAPVADGATATSRGERVSARARSLRPLAA